MMNENQYMHQLVYNTEAHTIAGSVLVLAVTSIDRYTTQNFHLIQEFTILHNVEHLKLNMDKAEIKYIPIAAIQGQLFNLAGLPKN